jgi:hypothetical protein
MLPLALAWFRRYGAPALFVCAAFWGAGYVWEFHRHVGIEPLSGDAVGGALPRWLRGDSFRNLTHHNFAQAPVQVVLMLADIYLGPFPWWSRVFGYAAWILFFVTLRYVAPAPRGDLVATIGVLLWFCFMNRASLFAYSWVQVEVGCQLLSLAGILLAGMVWARGEFPRKAILLVLLGVWVFVFSHSHKGFYFPLLFGLLGVFLADSRRASIGFAAFLGAYLCYILWIDGFVWMFATDAKDGRAKNYGDMAIAMALLGTGAIGAALREIASNVHLTLVRCVLFLVGIGMGIDALRRIAILRQAQFVSVAALIWPAAGMIVTTAIGRFAQVGFKLEEGERYWYNSVLFLLGILVYAALLPRRAPFVAIASVVGAAGVILMAATANYMPHFVRYWYTENCIQLGRALNPEVRWENGGYDGSVVDGFRVSRQFLCEKRADVFSFPGLASLEYFPKPTESAPLSDNVTASKTSLMFGTESLDLVTTEIAAPLDADIGVLWEQGRPIAVSYIVEIQGGRSMRHYAPRIAAGSQLMLYKWDSAGQVVAVCQCQVKETP